MSGDLGGLAKTVNYKGNRIDIGGHRFFSKSDRVMQWWLDVLPLQKLEEDSAEVSYQGRRRSVPGAAAAPNPGSDDLVILVRNRLSRIYFMRRFLSYPIGLSLDTIRILGLFETFLIGLSYIRSMALP